VLNTEGKLSWGWARTNSSCSCHQVAEPEHKVLSPEFARMEDYASQQKREEKEDGQLLDHLGYKVCNGTV
jgi:hypothetical protein